MTWNDRSERDTPEYKEWTSAVRKRDKGRCQMPGCKRRGKEVHHIQRWADAPLLRYEEDNGILLCKGCHYEIRNNEGHFVVLFMEIVASKK